MDKFLIRINETKDESLTITNQIRDFLVAHNKSVFIDKIGPDSYMNENGFIATEKFDAAIVLGGDGTILRAARDFVTPCIPILGINMGTVGYLSEIGCDDIENALLRLINDDFEIEERMMLEGTLYKKGEASGHAIALNDIVVSKETPFSAINFDIYVNDRFLNRYGADGIIISTPTGSTGYNLSAGGPIVEPGADLLVMTPVSPHTLNSRSIILSAQDVVRVKILEGKQGSLQHAVAMADSANRFSMESGDYFELRRSESRALFIKLSRASFLEVLHRKLQ